MTFPWRSGAAVAALLLAGSAAAQHPGPGDAGVPDVPEGEGRIVGRVVHASQPDAAAGIPVVLYALSKSGGAGLRRAETDGAGAFSFEGVSTDPGVAYLIGAQFAGIPFATRTAFGQGEREKAVEIRVVDPSDAAGKARTGEVQMQLDAGCDALQVIESVELRNPTERVIFVPPDERADVPPLFRAELPAGAQDFQTPLGSLEQGLTAEGDTVSFFGPLYPGTQEVRYGYGLAAAGGALHFERRFPTGAEGVTVLTRPGGVVGGGAGLRPGGEVVVDGERFASARTGALPAGAVLSADLTLPPPAESDALSLGRATLWLELDDAALSVSEELELDVAGDDPLGSGGAPLLCLSLPAGARDLRFATSSLELGLSPAPGGALALRGPLPPGTSTLAMRYLLPADAPAADGATDFAQSLPLPTPLVQIFVADTGVLPKSERLHRRRPVRSADRFYHHLEAFQVAAGEPVALRLERLAPQRGSRALAPTFLVLAAVGAVLFLGAPLRRAPEREAREEAPEAVEREALYAAMQALDEDFETGKLSRDDHEAMRQELRARAGALLRAERARRSAEAAAAPAPEPPSTCPACGAEPPPDARFCPRCGKAQGAADAPGTPPE